MLAIVLAAAPAGYLIFGTYIRHRSGYGPFTVGRYVFALASASALPLVLVSALICSPGVSGVPIDLDGARAAVALDVAAAWAAGVLAGGWRSRRIAGLAPARTRPERLPR